MKERRDWIQDWKAEHGGKPPDSLDKFYTKDNLQVPLTPAEEAQKKVDDEEKAKLKDKKKKKGGAKKKSKKGKKKEADPTKLIAKVGPSEVV